MSPNTLPDPSTNQHTSTKGYNMHDEYAPQPLSASHCPEDTTAAMHPQEEDAQDPARRRGKARSSSMYEEWEAQALRNDSSGVAAPVAGEKKSKKDNERAEKQASAQEGGTADGKSRRQRRGSTSGRGRRQSNANRENNGNRDNANRHRTPFTKRDDNPGPSEPEPRRDKGYTAPNGTYFTPRELAKLSRGLKIPNGDTVYFRPSFVEDPWKDMPAIKTHCLARY